MRFLEVAEDLLPVAVILLAAFGLALCVKGFADALRRSAEEFRPVPLTKPVWQLLLAAGAAAVPVVFLLDLVLPLDQDVSTAIAGAAGVAIALAYDRLVQRPLQRARWIPALEPTAAVADRWAATPKPVRAGLGLAALVFLVALPMLQIPVLDTPGSDFASVLFFPVGIYVLIAIGLNIVVGEAGLLDLGYVAFFAVGGYAMGLLGTEAGLSFPVILPIAVVLSMLAGILLGTPTLRLRGDYLAIVTLGFGEIIRIVARNTDQIGGPRGISNIPNPPDVGPVEFGVLDPKPYYWLLLAVIVLIVLMVRRLERSRVGRAWTAIREDEDAAELMGVPTFAFKLWAFAIGAGIGGLGGCIFAAKQISINPDNFQFVLSVLFLAAVVLGGAGNMPGVIVGATVVAYLPERFRGFAEYRVLVFGAALVAVMIFRPQGLLPNRRRAAELQHAPSEAEAAGAGAGGVAPGVQA